MSLKPCLFCLIACSFWFSAFAQDPESTSPPPPASALETNTGRLNEFVLDGTESCVEIRKGNAALRPTLGAITNAANYSNKIAPGGIAVLWGTRFVDPDESYVANLPLARALGRVQVLWRAADWVNNISGTKEPCGWRAAPVFYVGQNQINFQVPMFFYKPFSEENGDGYSRFSNFEGREYDFIVLAVLRDGVTKVSSNTLRLKINSHAPEFFPNAFVSFPEWKAPASISPGQTCVAFLSGLGKISDHEPEGYPPPAIPWTTAFPTFVEYRLNGARLLRSGYLFAGRAPSLVGVDQLNFVIPTLPLNSGESVLIHLCTGTDNGDRCSERGIIVPYRAP